MVILSFPTKAEAAWYQNNNGWRWKDQKSSYSANEWENINGNWYYFGSDGYMKSGWQYIGGNWYYLGEANDGAMKSGWQHINGYWYYLGAANDGAMRYGWQYIGGNWYYLGEANDGAMKIGWQTIEGEEYYFYEDGRRAAIITQYVDKTGSQAMFYTIETTKGDLIVIDGGWSENADYVRSVIKEKENHVSAWVLTHPHPDHIGAFNTIYADLQGIEIDDIYTIDMDYELYEEYAQYYDSFSTYETFCTLTKDAENLHYLYNGDVLDIGGCQIKVYNAYDDTIPNITKDLCNVGSMVFEVFGESSSMLFTSDINGKAICSKIIEQYGEELAATYMQVAHHGNQSVNHEFLDIVSPEVAFFDAPDWLIEGENYDTQENIDYMESLGAEVYTYETTPNRVILK